MDADEYMEPEDAVKIAKLLERISGEGYDGIFMGCQQIDESGQIFSSGTQMRFFRNSADLRYRRRIHEQLESVTGRELCVGDVTGELSVFHTGYQKKTVKEKKKNERNVRLIQMELQEDPNSYEMMGYMGDEYMDSGENAEAERWYHLAVEHMPANMRSNDQRSAVTLTRLMILLSEKEKASWSNIEPVYQKAVRLFAEEADFDYVAGHFFASQGQTELAAEYLERSVEKLNTYGYCNKAFFLGANLLEAYELLVRCFYKLGDGQKCMIYGTAYLRHNRYSMGVLCQVLKMLFTNQEQAGEEENQTVLGFFSKLYDFGNLKDRLFLVKAAERAKCQNYADYVAAYLFTVEERRVFGLLGKGE